LKGKTLKTSEGEGEKWSNRENESAFEGKLISGRKEGGGTRKLESFRATKRGEYYDEGRGLSSILQRECGEKAEKKEKGE